MPLRTDPCDWKLDDGHDLIVPLEYTRDLDAVVQSCDVNLRAVRGEWFANLDDGMPWYENDDVPERLALLGGKFNEARILAEFRTALLGSFGVARVLSLKADFNRSTRQLSVDWVVLTVWGDTAGDTLAEQEV